MEEKEQVSSVLRKALLEANVDTLPFPTNDTLEVSEFAKKKNSLRKSRERDALWETEQKI